MRKELSSRLKLPQRSTLIVQNLVIYVLVYTCVSLDAHTYEDIETDTHLDIDILVYGL